MAILPKTSNGPSHNVRYSTLLGGLFMATEGNLAVIEDAKKEFTDAQLKQGFVGDAGKKVRDTVEKANDSIIIGGFDGKLTYCSLDKRDVNGTEMEYVTIGCTDKGETTFFSTALATEVAMSLINKLANAEFGVYTKVTANGQVQRGQGQYAGKLFAQHSVFIEQGSTDNLTQLKGADRSSLKIQQDQTVAALAANDITEKDAVAKAKKSVAVKWHRNLLQDILKRYQEYRAASPNASHASNAAAENSGYDSPAYHAGTGMSGAGSSFNDLDYDPPF
jgi:hypothetical protein